MVPAAPRIGADRMIPEKDNEAGSKRHAGTQAATRNARKKTSTDEAKTARRVMLTHRLSDIVDSLSLSLSPAIDFLFSCSGLSLRPSCK